VGGQRASLYRGTPAPGGLYNRGAVTSAGSPESDQAKRRRSAAANRKAQPHKAHVVGSGTPVWLRLPEVSVVKLMDVSCSDEAAPPQRDEELHMLPPE